jgi:uncharacterized coiled-coil DUF342 family protein
LSNCEGHEVLKLEIDNIKEDIDELKTDAKEDRKFFVQTISELKENDKKLTAIIERMDEKQSYQDKRLDGINTTTKWALGLGLTIISLFIAVVKLV